MEHRDTGLDSAPLLAAIARMQQENSRESREAVLDLVIGSAQFLAPVQLQEKGGAAGPEFQFQLLNNQEGQLYFPAFTGWEELRKLCGPQNQQTLLLAFDDYANLVLRDRRAAGFVIDPFGARLSFPREIIQQLVLRKAQQGGDGQK